MVRHDRQGKPHRWVTRSGNGMRWVGVSDRFGCDRIHTHARNRAYLEHVVLGGAHDEGGPTGTRGQPGTPDRRSRGRQADARGPSGGGERWARGCVRTKGRGREHRRVHGSDRDARARSCVADGDTTSQIVPGEQKQCITTAGQRVPLRTLPLDEHDCRHLNFLLKYITRLRSRTACVAADRARPFLPRPFLLQSPLLLPRLSPPVAVQTWSKDPPMSHPYPPRGAPTDPPPWTS